MTYKVIESLAAEVAIINGYVSRALHPTWNDDSGEWVRAGYDRVTYAFKELICHGVSDGETHLWNEEGWDSPDAAWVAFIDFHNPEEGD